MSEPFLGEIRLMSFNFAPKGWAPCDGQFLPINQNQALFSLLQTRYGGNGQTTFALPDLRDRVPVHVGGGHTQGERYGAMAHTLTLNELPQHVHPLRGAAADATSIAPAANVVATSPANPYVNQPPATTLVALNPATVSTVGGSQPHLNAQPFLTMTFCIALQGIFPSDD